MGLTNKSVGAKAMEREEKIKKEGSDKIIVLAGNPNVGKSSVFNALTKMHQHTGNWPGKTVTSAWGRVNYKEKSYIIADIPGMYSLSSRSKEEETARDFLCFEENDGVVIVCDSTSLERNLFLAIECMEVTDKVILCLNLTDEAKRKGIIIDEKKLSGKLGVSAVKVCAKTKSGLSELLEEISKLKKRKIKKVTYPDYIENAIDEIEKHLPETILKKRWLSLKLIEGDLGAVKKAESFIGINFSEDVKIQQILKKLDRKKAEEDIALARSLFSKSVLEKCVSYKRQDYNVRDRKIDKILTGPIVGSIAMLCLLGIVFYITISGANVISDYFVLAFSALESWLLALFEFLNVPKAITDALIFGVFRVVGWVVSVMLPPMAIFFPLFTFLEDLGYLPRVAFNLDSAFKKCSACGKQALTMCMGFGCNSAGIVGARIIDSPRERLIAILTNSFVPCNGKFPALIAIIAMFFTFSLNEPVSSLLGALFLLIFVLAGVFMTFLSSHILSKTLLKGESSAFTLELAPYRKPKLSEIIVRSVFDRTLFVLGRAITVSAPAGLLIYLMANIEVSDINILKMAADFLDAPAKLLGLDGVILLSFILALPANELVLPLMLMIYTSSSSLSDIGALSSLRDILISNGWTALTAVNTILFFILHWPCSTAILTVKKETKSLKWAFFSFLIPTLAGIFVLSLTTLLYNVFF